MEENKSAVASAKEERQYPYYSPETKELFKALCDAKKKFKKAKLDKQGNYGPYASYESLEEATLPALCEYGLFVKQSPGWDDGQDFLYTTITHTSGQHSIDRMALRTASPDMQKLGGAVSYAQRYAYGAGLGISIGEDDDGEANAQSFQKREPDMRVRPNNRDLPSGKPTDAQLFKINQLIKQFPDKAAKLLHDPVNDIKNLTMNTASNLIDDLKEGNK